MIDFDKLTPWEVKLVQAGLDHFGFEPGPIDGIPGRLTRGAYEMFIRDETSPGKEPVLETEFDKRTEKHLSSLHPKLRQKARKPVAEAREIIKDKLGVDYILISGLRTYEEQNALYAKGRTKPGPKVTNVRGGFSMHNFGLALDGGIFRDGKYLDGSKSAADRKLAAKAHRMAGHIFKNHGWDWGGDWTSFKDYPHVQWRTGVSMAELRRRKAAGRSVI